MTDRTNGHPCLQQHTAPPFPYGPGQSGYYVVCGDTFDPVRCATVAGVIERLEDAVQPSIEQEHSFDSRYIVRIDDDGSVVGASRLHGRAAIEYARAREYNAVNVYGLTECYFALVQDAWIMAEKDPDLIYMDTPEFWFASYPDTFDVHGRDRSWTVRLTVLENEVFYAPDGKRQMRLHPYV